MLSEGLHPLAQDPPEIHSGEWNHATEAACPVNSGLTFQGPPWPPSKNIG